MNRTQGELRDMVHELLNLEDGLSKWEIQLLENVAKAANFTLRQSVKIEQIWDEKIGRAR